MNAWDFMRWLIERYPGHCCVGAIASFLLAAHAVSCGFRATVTRNVIPFKMPVDEGLVSPKVEPKK